MLKNRVIYLVLVGLLALFRIAYTGYAAGMLLLIALVLPVFSWFISLPGALYTKISLSAPDQVIRGSEAAVTLSVRHSRLFSTGPVRGSLTAVSAAGGRQKVRLKCAQDGFPLDTSHCCRYDCDLRRLRVLDLTGLLPMPCRRPKPLAVTVTPFPSEPPEHPDWTMGAQLINRPFSGGGNPYDLREYRVGDTLRSIHWKKSAALDKTVVRDTLEPFERIASIWIDWPEDPDGRDLALDQLAWCLIYLKQNNAGLRLRWLNRSGADRELIVLPGQLDSVMPQMLAQPPGLRCPASRLRPGEILLSAGYGEEAGAQ